MRKSLDSLLWVFRTLHWKKVATARLMRDATVRTFLFFYIPIMVIHFGIECWWNSIFGYGAAVHMWLIPKQLDDGNQLMMCTRCKCLCRCVRLYEFCNCLSSTILCNAIERQYGKMEIIMRTFWNYLKINADSYSLSKIKTAVTSGERPITIRPSSLFHSAFQQPFGITWKLL